MATILIVDDDGSLRSVLRMILEHDGYSVLEAENGKAGLELLRTLKPELMIIDIAMPELDGVETIRAAARDCTGSKILAMSGIARYASCRLSAALEVGAHETLQKPFSRELLLQAVRRMLEQKQRRGFLPR